MSKQLLSLFFIVLFSSVGFAQLQCGGYFYDSGLAGNYPANADEITTICPDVPGEAVTVTFTSFQTEAQFDGLYVFDGNSTNAPQISSGQAGNVPGGMSGAFWGTTAPGPFTSTSPDGCLTFWFKSDSTLENGGWEAMITCGSENFNCPAPTALTVSNIMATTALLSWTETGTAVLWEVLAIPCGAPAPTVSSVGTLVTANPYMFPALSPSTCYNFYVRAHCENSVSVWSQSAIATTVQPVTLCGEHFYDNGGANGNYSNLSNATTTICPENPGDVVSVSFNSFNTEATRDGLYVYNGNSTSAPMISSGNLSGNVPGGLPGSFWGTTIPGPFESTSTDGCLTFVFKSDTSVNMPGWDASVYCGPPSNCFVPNGVSVTNVTTDSATIGWTSVGDATQWQLTVTPSVPGSPFATSNNPFVLAGLSSDTTYSVSIKTICEEGWMTVSTPPVSFVTAMPETNPLSVNTTLYTPAELISNVLIDNPCLEITNVTSSTGTTFGSTNGIGFFQNDNPNFPLTSGIVLSTGDAANVPGPNTSALSDGNGQWPGDSDLEAIISTTLGTPMNSRNATKLEFDFTALNEFMSFNFLFASDEYGTFQCNYADAFAFLLTDLETGITTNLAVVPGTQDPVSVVTIRDGANNTGCASANEGYFGQYFGTPDYDGATNFIGQTAVMTASSVVIPNHPYHIKLVVADRNDTLYDSAVFIEAGSFTSGPPQCSDKLQLVAFVDENEDGIKDANEDIFNHGSFTVEQNDSGDVSQVYSPFGSYDLYDANPANTYDLGYVIQSGYAPYYTVSATYDNMNIAVGSGEQIVYFPVTLTQPFNDVAVSIVSISAPRPAMTYQNKVIYTNNGVSPASGTITFTKDALVTITDVSQPGTVANLNGFTYNFTDLQPNETRMFFVTLSVPAPPTVNQDDLLTNAATISAVANDIDLANNTFSNTQVVVNSYDPNMIIEAHGEQIDINTFSVNEFLYYTIYFQNTGTASAIQVRIDDVLDPQLDENTVVMLNASHNFVLQRKQNHLKWIFDYIMLPGQMQNDQLSKGYVFFKIKVKPGFQAGDIIPNTAQIYFDSNPAVVTNTFNTMFIDALQNDDFDASSFVLFPNPASSAFTVSFNNTSEVLSNISVYDMLGKKVTETDGLQQSEANVNVTGLSKGVYLVEIMTASDKRLVRKLVIE